MIQMLKCDTDVSNVIQMLKCCLELMGMCCHCRVEVSHRQLNLVSALLHSVHCCSFCSFSLDLSLGVLDVE